MPRVGSKQSSVWNPFASQRAIVTFCWLPPESRRTWRWARVSIESASIAPCTRLRSSRMPTGPQRRALLKRGAAMFSRDRALRQQRLQPVGRHEDDAGADRVVGMARTQRLPLDEDVAAGLALLAGEHVEELVLALRLERRDPEDLARPERERHVGERLADLEPAHLERRRPGGELDPLPLRRRLGDAGRTRDLLAEHVLDDLLLAALLRDRACRRRRRRGAPSRGRSGRSPHGGGG